MQLPAHIADRIRRALANVDTGGGHVESEAARHGGITLMATLGAIWLMRPDGTLWEVDEETGKPLQPLAPDLEVNALVAGVERHSWLAELVPARPADAVDCVTCRGRGRLFSDAATEDNFVYCPHCRALGWVPVPA